RRALHSVPTRRSSDLNLNGAGWTDLPGSSLSGLADGSYQFRAVVTDNAGNSSNTTAISVIVDNTAPTAGTLTFANLADSGHTDTERKSTRLNTSHSQI